MELVSAWLPPPRWKQHAAQSGYVYQYILQRVSPAYEYDFLATSGPSIERRLRVSLDAAVIADWSARQRPLTDVECYGIAKLTLLRILDEARTPADIPEIVQPTFETVAEICIELDL